MSSTIRLRGISGEVKGKYWESSNVLRAGRLGTLEIVLEDSSVSRRHAELRRADSGWWVRDLDSTNGTFVNGVRLGPGERQLHSRDIVQFGKVAMMVELVESPSSPSPRPHTLSEQIIVEAEASSSWQEGFERILVDRNHSPRPGDQLLALL
ncbi:MAG: FHA domain-containing protein, partial [Nitrospira sp.]|nr:FHA domain-containing protein [Nitrospira sp.]MDW8224334.1 FHA domain-containing protein [Gemmatales bacterium]